MMDQALRLIYLMHFCADVRNNIGYYFEYEDKAGDRVLLLSVRGAILLVKELSICALIPYIRNVKKYSNLLDIFND